MNQQEATDTVIRWVLSAPVLTWRLALIARDGAEYADGGQELMCTVADLLDPGRNSTWRGYLTAVGARFGAADETWAHLGGIAGIHAVDWSRVLHVLLEADRLPDRTEEPCERVAR